MVSLSADSALRVWIAFSLPSNSFAAKPITAPLRNFDKCDRQLVQRRFNLGPGEERGSEILMVAMLIIVSKTSDVSRWQKESNV